MDVFALILALAGLLAALGGTRVSAKERAGAAVLALIMIALSIFVMLNDSWEMDATVVVLAAVPLLVVTVRTYQAKARRA